MQLLDVLQQLKNVAAARKCKVGQMCSVSRSSLLPSPVQCICKPWSRPVAAPSVAKPHPWQLARIHKRRRKAGGASPVEARRRSKVGDQREVEALVDVGQRQVAAWGEVREGSTSHIKVGTPVEFGQRQVAARWPGKEGNKGCFVSSWNSQVKSLVGEGREGSTSHIKR